MNAPTPTIREVLEPFAKAARAFESAIGPDGIDDGLTVEARISARPEREAVLSTADFSRARTFLESIPADGGTVKALQDRVRSWTLECFGDEIACDLLERMDRFTEEALELVQSLGYTPDRAHALVDYVFGREAGEPSQETGGTMTTLAALCNVAGIDIEAAFRAEVERITTPAMVMKIRAKQAAKPTGSALPVALSTHTAAGAGPVGESVGMGGARAISSARMTSVSSVRITSDNPARLYARPVEEPGGSAEAGQAVAVRDWLLVAKAAGEHGVRYRTNRALKRFLSSVLPVLTRPVDEPGEVERLTRERDDAVVRYASAVKDAAEQRALAERRRETICQYMNEDGRTGGAALAEMQTRLVEVEAEGRELRDPRVIQEIMSALALRSKQTKATRDEPHTRSVTAIVERFARAALTGDAQEAKAPAGDA